MIIFFSHFNLGIIKNSVIINYSSSVPLSSEYSGTTSPSISSSSLAVSSSSVIGLGHEYLIY